MSKLLYASSLIALWMSTSSAHADSAETTHSASVYKLSDFDKFAPSTALDILRNIPGFKIADVDEKRGLGQGGGNVLVNGKRLSSKSTGISTLLNQISAKNVTQITVQDASEFDIPGLSGEVANIETQVSGFTGRWSWNPEIRQHRSAALTRGDISISGQNGPFEYTITIDNELRRNQARGPEEIRNATGDLLEHRNESIHFTRDRPSISTRIGYEGLSGNTGSLNLNYENADWNFTEWSDRQTTIAGQNNDFRVFLEGGQEWNAEINADYEFNLGAGRLKLISLYSIENSPYFNQVHYALNDEVFERGAAYRSNAEATETIFRGEYSWKSDSGNDWQFSAETAYNSLERDGLEFAQLEINGLAQPSFIANSAPTFDLVEEQRSEIALTHGRPLTSKISLQASLGSEYSQISQSGSGEANREFFRPKGFVSLSFSPTTDLTFSTKIERQVGQLDFGDFIASRDIAENNDNGTNTDIVPEQSWRLAFDLTKQHGAWGSSTLKLAAENVEDAIDQIPLDAFSEAPGNLDTPTQRFEATWLGTLNFDPLGAQGLKLNYTLNAADSKLEDPLTGESRRIGGETMSSIVLDFRYDIPNTNWAFSTFFKTERYAYNPRLNLNLREHADDPFIGASVEYKDFFGMKANLSIRNLGNQSEKIFKEYYVDRRDSPVSFTEFRERKYDPYIYFKLSGNF